MTCDYMKCEAPATESRPVTNGSRVSLKADVCVAHAKMLDMGMPMSIYVHIDRKAVG